MRYLALLVLMASATAAVAQGVRPSDTALDEAGLSAALSGQMIEFFDGSKSYYNADGSYIYTYVDGGEKWDGSYVLGPEGSVCVDFVVSGSRCDTFVMDGDRLVLIIEDGTRFPVRGRIAME